MRENVVIVYEWNLETNIISQVINFILARKKASSQCSYIYLLVLMIEQCVYDCVWRCTLSVVCTWPCICLLYVRGVGPGCNTREIADKLIDLKAELDDLALRENELDQQRVWVQQSIKNVTDDSNNSPYPSLHTVFMSPMMCPMASTCLMWWLHQSWIFNLKAPKDLFQHLCFYHNYCDIARLVLSSRATDISPVNICGDVSAVIKAHLTNIVRSFSPVNGKYAVNLQAHKRHSQQ